MAQTLLRPASGRLDRSPSGRTAPEFSPLTWWSRSRRWPANCRRSTGAPLARWQCPDLARAAVEQGIVASISGTTIWRWLTADAIKPWQHRSWIFPRDPDFGAKAARVLDLVRPPLRRHAAAADEDYVISADEKTSIQARDPQTPHLPPAPRRPMRVEHEYAPRRRPGLPGRLGRAPRQGVRPLRTHHRHRPVRPARRPGHDPRALRLGPPGVTGWSTTAPPTAARPPSTGSKTLAQPAADPPARPRVLA